MAIHISEKVIIRPSFLGDGNWSLKNLNHITVLFGKNGSGKSVLLRGIMTEDKEHTHYASPERAGDISYKVNLLPTQSNARTRADSRTKNTAPSYRPEVIARIIAYLAKRGAIRGEINRANPETIERMIGVLSPDFSFEITGGNPPYTLTRVDSKEIIGSVDNLSSA